MFMKRVLLVTLVAACSPLFAQVLINPATGNGYVLTGPVADITAARSAANSMGGYLVAINDAAEQAWLGANFGVGRFWIGLSDEITEGTFLWDSGEPFIYSNWCAGEPNNAGGIEDYAEILGGGCWNDQPANGNFLIAEGIVELPGFGVPAFQANRAEAMFDLNGMVGSVYQPSRVTTCVGAPTVVNMNAAVGAGWELIIRLGALAGAGAGGLTLADGQVLNVPLSGAVFLNGGGATPLFVPFPGLISAPVTPTLASVISAQMVVLDGTLPLGLALSGPGELTTLAGGGISSVAGPTGDDVSVTVDVASAPLCWCPSGVQFFGATYSNLGIASNGRVMFGATDDDFSASIAEALTDQPFVGVWTDLSPNVGGSVTATSPAPGIVRVDYSGVPYFGQAVATASFGIELNCFTGDVMIDGVQGIMQDPSNVPMFLGVSPGVVGPATDPGASVFMPGAVGAAGAATDMTYEFGAGSVPAVAAGVTTLLLTPDGGGNYTWFAF